MSRTRIIKSKFTPHSIRDNFFLSIHFDGHNRCQQRQHSFRKSSGEVKLRNRKEKFSSHAIRLTLSTSDRFQTFRLLCKKKQNNNK